MKQHKTYEEAFQELQEIVQEIENGDVNVDVLGEKVRRAGELMRFCREKLFKTEKEVQQVLKEFGNDSAKGNDSVKGSD